MLMKYYGIWLHKKAQPETEEWFFSLQSLSPCEPFKFLDLMPR
jgi:hypothetical protein